MWQDMGIERVFFFVDNANACVWLQKGFSSSPIAQEMCRVVCGLEFKHSLRSTSVWTPTKVNLLADTRSRVRNEDGTDDYTAWDEFHRLNGELSDPYTEVTPCDNAVAMFAHIEQLDS